MAAVLCPGTHTMHRDLLNLAASAAQQLDGTVTSDIPSSPPSTGHHVSSTSLFIIYMVIGFSVTFACILILMTVYHCFRHHCFMRIIIGPRTTEPLGQSSGCERHPGHEPKEMFIVKHPGGDANLAFRENEELKPYTKKSKASLYCGSLDDDSFTIPAWTQDSALRDASVDGSYFSAMDSTQPEGTSVIDALQPADSTDVWPDDASISSTPRQGQSSAPAQTASVASTASQTFPR